MTETTKFNQCRFNSTKIYKYTGDLGNIAKGFGLTAEREETFMNSFKCHYDTDDIMDLEKQVLHSLHETHLWSIKLSNITDYTINNVVLFLKHENLKRELFWMRLLNKIARFLVVVTGVADIHLMASDVLKVLESFDIKDVLLLVQNTSTDVIELFTWLPYNPPSGICGYFQEVLHVDTWKNGTFIFNSEIHPQKATNDLNGCMFTIDDVSEIPPFIYEIAGVKEGIIINMLATLSETFNMSFNTSAKYKHPPSKSIQIDHYPISVIHFISKLIPVPYYTQSLTFFVPHSKPNSRWPSLLRVFTWDIWICIFIGLGVTALTFKYISGKSGFGESLLDLWSILLSVSVNIPQEIHTRFIFFAWVIYSLCVNTVFQTYFTSYFIEPGFQHQIDTVEELRVSDFTLITDSALYSLYHFQAICRKNIFVVTYQHITSLYYVMSFPNTALFSIEDSMQYYIKEFCTRNTATNIHKFRTFSVQMKYGYIPYSNSLLHPRLNELITRLVQTGIPIKFHRDTNEIIVNHDTYINSDSEYLPFSLEHLQSPFLLYLTLVLTCVITFCLELFTHQLRKYVNVRECAYRITNNLHLFILKMRNENM
ncbi:hypothetical protein L9F63_001389 [Diploptera punctata]|uniref:Uncharacterized protein n=1 Tax=Diploptera punctata TaxID=6984 RepID=A0AAD8A4P4_DIPPU|nr:hypothetical protein L9F63_001389 [Diploptera punctata]